MAWSDFTVDPSNIPLARPGVYLLRNIINHKCYIGISGNVRSRLNGHSTHLNLVRKLPSAIKSYGTKSFEAVPLYYSTCGTGCLEEIENSMIIAYDAIDHGYNTIEVWGGVGPYGETYADMLRNLRWITDGTNCTRIAKESPIPDGWRYGRIIDTFQSDEYRKRQQDHGNRIWSNPEYREKATEIRQQVWNKATEEKRRAHGAAISAGRSDPERRQQYSAIVSNLIWITNGAKNTRIPSQEPVPAGWRRGQTRKAQDKFEAKSDLVELLKRQMPSQ